ncbi:transcription factor LBX1 [Elysia marginata]|uniref:Transcription factor LBX1 n=1 Tax=Elysia marginata TaxID=1093978 RepID=A0AAV4HCX8_9GAST|nr:transcription factor LBX1 [Elysia marginata]
MTMSRVDEEVGDSPMDSYEPIKRLAMVQIQPPRNPSKPFTSFGIKDILGPVHSSEYKNTPIKDKKLGEIEEGDKSRSSRDNKHKQSDSLNCCLENQVRSLKRSLCMSPDTSPSENFDKDNLESQQNHKPNATKRRASDHIKDFHCKSGCPVSEYNFLHDSKLHEPSRPETFRDSDDEHQHPLPDLPNSPAQLGLCSPPLDGRRFPLGSVRPRSALPEDFPSPAWNVDDTSKPVNLSTTKIVRPWDSDAGSLSPHAKGQQQPGGFGRIFTPTPGAILTASEASSDEEEISVDDDDPPPRRSLIAGLSSGSGRSMQTSITNVKNPTSCNKASSNSSRKKLQSVSPLDALMAMTSKTFEGLDTSGSSGKSQEQFFSFTALNCIKQLRHNGGGIIFCYP